MFGNLKPYEVIILLVVLVLLFGSKKLPDAARSLGRSMRILRSEVKGMAGDSAAEQPGKADEAGKADGETR